MSWPKQTENSDLNIFLRTLHVSQLPFGVTKDELARVFQNDDDIEIFTNSCTNFALITFKNIASAERAQNKKNILDGKVLKTTIADVPSTSTDEYFTEQKSTEKDPTLLATLNDDCMCKIFSYLNLLELKNVEKVNRRFRRLVMMIYKSCRVLNFNNCGPMKLGSLKEGKTLLDLVGPNIHTLVLPAYRFFLTQNDETILLRTVINRCSFGQLEHLHLSHFDKSHTKDIAGILRNVAYNLITLQLNHCDVTDSIGPYLAAATKLQVLNLARNNNINGHCLMYVSNLLELNIRDCNVEQYYFRRFCQNNKTLKCLDLYSCHTLTTECIIAMIYYLTSLEHLIIIDCYRRISLSDFSLFGKLPSLRKLHLRSYQPKYTKGLLSSLAVENSLEELEINDGIITRGIIENINCVASLKILKLMFVHYFDDDKLKLLANCSNLIELHLARIHKISSKSIIDFINNCRMIKIIKLRQCGPIDCNFISVNINKNGFKISVSDTIINDIIIYRND